MKAMSIYQNWRAPSTIGGIRKKLDSGRHRRKRKPVEFSVKSESLFATLCGRCVERAWPSYRTYLFLVGIYLRRMTLIRSRFQVQQPQLQKWSRMMSRVREGASTSLRGFRVKREKKLNQRSKKLEMSLAQTRVREQGRV